jgi:hypothetical protein
MFSTSRRTELGLKWSYLNVISELAALSEDLYARAHVRPVGQLAADLHGYLPAFRRAERRHGACRSRARCGCIG